MGWMSWQTFRCETDCQTWPDRCISERLYRETTDALAAGGFLAAGYTGVHLDDCIVAPSRDAAGDLVADPARFPSGFAALGAYIHARGAKFGFYTAMGASTCAGRPGSAGHEAQDAAMLARIGADYLKADGCGDVATYPTAYPLMGAALQASGRNITFSCSWPAYLGDDEAAKPFAAFIAAGCNLWRNYLDMGPVAGYVQGIIKHFGNYSEALAEWGPGHDADMLIAGVDGVPLAAQGAQMAIYCILALPLIMGSDARAMPPASAAILLNPDAIAINQDPAMRPGVLLGGAAAAEDATQVWFRPLASGEVAVALYNQGPPPSHPWHTSCEAFNATQGGYFSPAGPSPAGWCFTGFGQANLEWYCCNTGDCAGYNFSTVTGAGCLFKDVDGPFVAASGVNGYTCVPRLFATRGPPAARPPRKPSPLTFPFPPQHTRTCARFAGSPTLCRQAAHRQTSP